MLGPAPTSPACGWAWSAAGTWGLRWGTALSPAFPGELSTVAAPVALADWVWQARRLGLKLPRLCLLSVVCRCRGGLVVL